MIVDGQFDVPADKGLFPGTFRVEITATRATGKTQQDPVIGQIVAVVEQYLPERYNNNTELTIEVPYTSAVPLEFALNSR